MALTADEVVRFYRRASVREGELEAFVERLRAEPEAAAVLDEIAKKPGAIRGWAAHVASLALPAGSAVPILLRVARSRDVDVRDGAIQDLLRVDPVAARRLAPLFHRMLGDSGDWHANMVSRLSGMWGLLAIGARDAEDRMRALRDDVSQPENVREAADAVLLALEDPDAALRRADDEASVFVQRAAEILRRRTDA